MGTSLGTLGDLFPDKDIRCRVRGCNNTWRFSGQAAMKDIAAGRNGRPDRMCDECFAEFQLLQDQEVPCATKGCAETWRWNRFQQLEASKRGHTRPPAGYCEACRERMRAMEDVEVTCRMRGCSKTWVWTRRAQMHGESEKPPLRMCSDCYDRLQQLEDLEVPCRVRGCEGTWLWNRFQQLEYELAGNSLESPPKRMCQECYRAYSSFQPRDMVCKVDECTRTWVWTPYAQLEHRLQNGPEAEEPSKMCRECYGFYMSHRDREISCRNRGCEHTWTYSRGDQLHDFLLGRRHLPAKLCDACAARILETDERQEPCSVPGCGGTWLYTAEEQVKDACLGRSAPTSRRCPDCETFLCTHQPQVISCTRCGREMEWSVYEQLLYKLGTFARPAMCSDCAEAEINRQAPVEPEPQRVHHEVIRVPARGKWNADDVIANWPPHMTHEVIHNMERADIRIVALGDDLTLSADDAAAAWPALLEKVLSERLQGQTSVGVVNAGIAGSGSCQGLVRFDRDVRPFRPHLVIISFCFNDSRVGTRPLNGEWKPLLNSQQVLEDTRRLVERIRRSGAEVLFWTANPEFPHEASPENSSAERQWAAAQELSRRQLRTQLTRLCSEAGVPAVDFRSRFEVNGARSAKKWMRDWYRHNETGARLIASWFADCILHEKLIPVGE